MSYEGLKVRFTDYRQQKKNISLQFKYNSEGARPIGVSDRNVRETSHIWS